MNGAVLSCVSTDVADQSRLFTDTSGSVTVLAASERIITTNFYMKIV